MNQNNDLNFINTIEPHLISDDLHVQEFVLQALMEYPKVPEEWGVRLLKDAFRHPEKTSVFVHAANFSINEEALHVLLEGMKDASPSLLRLLQPLLKNIPPDLAVKHKQALTPYISKQMWTLYHLLNHGDEEQVWEAYGEKTVAFERLKLFNQDLYDELKLIVRRLVEKGWYEPWEIDIDLREEKDQWYSIKGIMAVYAAGLLNLTEQAPLLASLLMRDEEDLLSEEVSATLIRFQNDKVLKAVEPYLTKKESAIFAVSVFSNRKSNDAINMLKKAYKKLKDVDDKAFVFEAMTHQLSEDVLPEIQDYMRLDEQSYIVDTVQTAYGFYKVMGIDHPDLKNWKAEADAREASYRKAAEESMRRQDQAATVKKTVKVGRNDPCPCGSGKKYKKCCGQ